MKFARRGMFVLCLILLLPFAQEVVAATGPASAPVAVERNIPFKTVDETDTGALAIRIVAMLCLVLAIGVAALFLLRKYLPRVSSVTAPGVTREIELVEIRRITPRLTLFLVDVHGTRYLLAQSGDQLVTLTPPPPKS